MNNPPQRPPEFDARVMAYMPMIVKTATKLVPHGERQDFVQDALAAIFRNWSSFRGETYEHGSGFHNWIYWQVRAARSARTAKARRTVKTVYDDKGKYTNRIGRPAEQERALVAADIISRANGRDGDVLVRRGMGFSLQDICDDMGISRTRVQQLESGARKRLMNVAA